MYLPHALMLPSSKVEVDSDVDSALMSESDEAGIRATYSN